MGISTKVYTTDTFPVPNEWIFETFLNLNEVLEGQSVKIKSIFNKADKDPSMIIYYHETGTYKFKDFSSGLQGDGVDMIQYIYGLKTRTEAQVKVLEFWKENSGTVIERSVLKKEVSVENVVTRNWNELDAKYWQEYHIGSKELEHYNIKPIESYDFIVKVGENVNRWNFSKQWCYGYYNKAGILCKIYSPKDARKKFIKTFDYVQGHNQLEFKHDWLMIVASMKDLITFRKIGYPIECVAPDSENVIINEKQMAWYKKRYKLITVLFDNDVAGKKSALRYNELYNLPIINFEIEKDIAECVKQHGLKNTKIFLNPLLKPFYESFRRS